MSAPTAMEGLSLEQAPPLSIPLTFFLTAPVALALAGALLCWEGLVASSSMWMPATIALTHLGTLGVLAMVMWGALYQMIPVLAGAPVPAVRLARVVHVCLSAGVLALVGGVWKRQTTLVWAAVILLSLAFVLFVVPIGWALIRGSARTPTTTGMRLALLALTLTVILGALMAPGHAGSAFPGLRSLFIQVHLSVALLGWVGGLISAVSWQVVPMFYLAEEPSRRFKMLSLLAILSGVLLPVAVLLIHRFQLVAVDARTASRWAALAALPAVLAVWLAHPLRTLLSIARRRRKRADPSLTFWRVGSVLGVATGASAVAAHLLDDPRFGLLFGWLAIWGWAGTIMHGMLARIVPFLVWFHRFSPLVGRVAVPSVRKILPDRFSRVGFGLHQASLACGAVAIVAVNDLATRATGVLLIATAASLASSMIRALRQHPAAVGHPAAAAQVPEQMGA